MLVIVACAPLRGNRHNPYRTGIWCVTIERTETPINAIKAFR